MKGVVSNVRMTYKRQVWMKARTERRIRTEAWRLGITPELLKRVLERQRRIHS